MITMDDIAGAWRLVAWEIDVPGMDEPAHPFSDQPVGWLVYSSDGVMSAQLMRPDRPGLGGRSIRKLDEEERLAVLETFFAYAGHYYIDGDTIVHQVDVALNPDFIGQDQFRKATLNGKVLTLTGQETDVQGRQRGHRLIWERI